MSFSLSPSVLGPRHHDPHRPAWTVASRRSSDGHDGPTDQAGSARLCAVPLLGSLRLEKLMMRLYDKRCIFVIRK